ncbi:flavodoxin family protein [Agrilutibacter solisilvae]|uniref:NAD(P)H-dependent oxidoreductase n=1 Tax=Agrilutibacter solisilvae TaxID=2763317 RepID=A0A975AQV7_9GAMM|nr:NAD(P)H-dependent oxidoreductase [Lysobacter solisilvae]QSX77314.1 NAD(P)H-dependent oxidoreductase [Lysobacter solisilvae]
MTDPRHVLFLLGSARAHGNAEQLARRMAEHLAPRDECRFLRLADHPLPPFVDHRHDAGVYAAPTGHEAILAEATLAATDLVIAAPLYWYSLPASVKLYLDYWSAWMRVPGLGFREHMAGKRLWAVCVTSDEDFGPTAPFVEALRLSADYMGMEWGGALLARGNRPGDVRQDPHGWAAAASFLQTPLVPVRVEDGVSLA